MGKEGGRDEIYRSRPGVNPIWMQVKGESEVAMQYERIDHFLAWKSDVSLHVRGQTTTSFAREQETSPQLVDHDLPENREFDFISESGK
jgi:hypothetical protein